MTSPADRRRTIVAAVGATTLLALATVTTSGGAAVDAPGRSEVRTGRSDAKGTRCARENAAWIGSFGYGLSCIDEDGWHAFARDSSGLAGDLIGDITIGPDGRAWIVATGSVSVTNGRTWNTYGSSDWDGGSADAVALDADGNPWVAHFRGTSHFDGKQWTTWPATLMGTGDNVDLVGGVAVAPDGTVWTVTANSIASFDGTRWTVYEEDAGLDDGYSFHAIVAGPTGVWAAHSRGVLQLVDGTWVDHDTPDQSGVETMAMDADGGIWVGTWSHGVSLFDGTGWLSFDRENDGLSSDAVRSVAVDGQGRVWVGTDHGLDVYDGEAWQTWFMHDSPLLDNEVVSVGVAGSGPVLAPPAPKAPGGLSGTIVERGTPVAGTTVELCTQSVPFSTDRDTTPCADQVLSFQATTGPDGSFAFSDVPVGRYAIVARSSQLEWLDVTELTVEAYDRPLIPEGGTLDVGTLDLTKAD